MTDICNNIMLADQMCCSLTELQTIYKHLMRQRRPRRLTVHEEIEILEEEKSVSVLTGTMQLNKERRKVKRDQPYKQITFSVRVF